MTLRLFDSIHNAPDTATVRGVFPIDPARHVRLTLNYPASTGHDFGEIPRVIDSVQLTDARKIAMPADWRRGDDVIILPSLDDAAAKALFPHGWTTHTRYLRTATQPEPTG